MSKTQRLTTTEERGRTKVVPYAFVIGSIRYAMLSTAPDVCLATCLARGYKGHLGLDHQIAVKIILRGIRKSFLGYGGDKEFDVKSYVDASLTPIRLALSRDTGYV